MFEIVRFYAPGVDRDDYVVAVVDSLEEAQRWCRDPDTRKDGVFFDGYREIENG